MALRQDLASWEQQEGKETNLWGPRTVIPSHPSPSLWMVPLVELPCKQMDQARNYTICTNILMQLMENFKVYKTTCYYLFCLKKQKTVYKILHKLSEALKMGGKQAEVFILGQVIFVIQYKINLTPNNLECHIRNPRSCLIILKLRTRSGEADKACCKNTHKFQASQQIKSSARIHRLKNNDN